ncbi:MAG: tetratricopeptide repeat protein [Saprospiraceae bacterium]|nr:tetratricopeptide repeat protein [Saprospiraceae bacterium]
MRYAILILLLWYADLTLAQDRYITLENSVNLLMSKVSKGSTVSDTASLEYALALRDSIHRAGFKDLEAEVLITIGKLHQQLGRMGSAESFYKSAMVLGSQHKDSLWVAELWDRLGDFYALEERNYVALDCQLKSLELLEKYDSSRLKIADSYYSIARAYIQLGELDIAEKYLDRATLLKSELRDTLRLGIITTLQADIYRKRGQYDLAEQNYLKDIPKRQNQSNYEGLTVSYLGLAQNYFDWGKYQEAEIHYKKALQAAETIKRQRNINLILLRLGELYIKTNQIGEAKKVFSRAVENSAQIDSRIYQINGYRNLYQLAKDEGDLKTALEYMELYTAVTDSSAKESLALKMEDLKASFTLQERESEISRLDAENKKGRQLQGFLIAGILLLLALITAMILLYQSRKKALKLVREEQHHTKKLLTEKEQLLEDLQQSNIQLIHSEKMASLGIMTAGIAHELNNPVNSIITAVEALKMDHSELLPIFELLSNLKKDELSDHNRFIELQGMLEAINFQFLSKEVSSLMKTITNGAHRTAVIVSGLKTFSRDTGDQFIPVRIESGIETALTLLHHKLNEDIRIVKSYNTSREINCQVSRINQVFLNILDNAIFAIEEKGQIDIQTFETAEHIIIKIKDNGKGMDAQTKNRIFEPFFSSKEVGSGTGLGLSISYGIIKQHKGSIVVDSSPGAGTTFTISLPFSV